MKKPAWLGVAVTAIASALPGCDYVALKELKPGISTADEVRARMGQPTAEYANPDGSMTWEFNRQPNGSECYMATIGADRVLVRMEQVQRLIGRPGSVVTYANANEEVWDWRIAGSIPTEEAHFHAHFDPASGLITRTSRRVEPKG
jgi:hypothetical protein